MTNFDLTVQVPAVTGTFGHRLTTYSTAVKAAQITALLGHDPRPSEWRRLPPKLAELYKYVQRKPDKNRRDSVAGYVEERLSENPLTIGAFPAISIAFMKAVKFVPHEPKSAVGVVHLPLSKDEFRIVLDGLGRISGVLELEAQGDEQAALLNNFTFPVTVYCPTDNTQPTELTREEVAQLFHDFNFRVKPVSRSHAIALDSSDLYIQITNRLGATDLFKRFGGVAARVASLGSKSTELVTQQNLLRCVRGGCEGPTFMTSNTESVSKPYLTRERISSVLASFTDFFEVLATGMGDERFSDKSSIHLTAAGWQALGILHYDVAFRLKMNQIERQDVIHKLSGIDWTRTNPDWIGVIVAVERDKTTGEPLLDQVGRIRVSIGSSRRQDIERFFNHLRAKVGIPLPASPSTDTEVAEPVPADGVSA